MKLIAFPNATHTVTDNSNIFKKTKQNHHQTLTSNFVKQNKGTGPRMYKLMFCYIIVALASCIDIGYLAVSSRIDTSRVCALFFFSQKISLKDYPEAMNLKNQVNLSSCTDASVTLCSKNHEDVGWGETANDFPISIYCWRRPRSANFSPVSWQALLPPIPWGFLPIGTLCPEELVRQQRCMG